MASTRCSCMNCSAPTNAQPATDIRRQADVRPRRDANPHSIGKSAAHPSDPTDSKNLPKAMESSRPTTNRICTVAATWKANNRAKPPTKSAPPIDAHVQRGQGE
eukprot:13270423-Alexandrium_andersonii.AAC.1